MARKYALIIPDGCADEPIEALGGRTPLQAAHIPHMDQVALGGRLGRARTVPHGFTPASDVAMMSLFGYDPNRYYTGRAPLEAAAMDIELGPADWAFRCNLVTVSDAVMVDFSAGHISSEEARVLIAQCQEVLGEDTRQFFPGVSYRHLLVLRYEPGECPFGDDLATTPPHDLTGKEVVEELPRGAGSELLRDMMFRSQKFLPRHEVNRMRVELGENPANMIWLWGQGQSPSMPSFQERHGKRGAIISAVDLVRGLGTLVGWHLIDVPGATGYLDTDYAAKGRAAVAAIERYDLVVVHIEAPDEASHAGDPEAEVKAIEAIDREIVGPVLDTLRRHEDFRIWVSPDHATPIRTRTHDATPVPFAMMGTGIPAVCQMPFDEANAAASAFQFESAHELMAEFLHERSRPADA